MRQKKIESMLKIGYYKTINKNTQVVLFMNTSIHSKANDLPSEFLQTLETSFGKCVSDYLANALPELDKAKTAVFTSERSGVLCPFFDESGLQVKVAEEFSQLTGLGYDTMIVNTGTQYGMLALRVLSALKKKTPFRLIRSKVRGEFLEEPNLHTAALMSHCDSYVYADSADHYDEIILSRSSYVSNELGLAIN